MTVVTTRPDATVANGASTVTGAATRHAATSDDADSSYVVHPADSAVAEIGFAEPTIPAGGLVKLVALRVRSSFPGAGGIAAYAQLSVEVLGESAVVPVSWTTPTTHTALDFVYSETPAAVVVEIGTLYSPLGDPLRVYELYLDTVYVTRPVVAVAAPTGTITTNLAAVTWADTLDSDGGVQTAYEVKIFSDAQYGAGGFAPGSSTPTLTSGVQTGSETSWTAEDVFANDTYRAYVRVAQTVNGTLYWSNWDNEEFTVDADAPGDPTVTITAEPEDGRLAIALDDNPGDLSTNGFQIQKSSDGAWENIRTVAGDGYISGTTVTAYDLEAPNGVEVDYRVRAVHTSPLSVSAWVEESETWTSSGVLWIKHPTDPTLNHAFAPHSVPGSTQAVRRGLFQPLGRSTVITVDDTRAAKVGGLEVRADSEADRDALGALLDSGASLLVQGTADDYWVDRWVRFGDQSSAPYADKGWVAESIESLPWTEVQRPPDNLEAWPT